MCFAKTAGAVVNLHRGIFLNLYFLFAFFKHYKLNILKNELMIHKFKIWNKIMHVIKVAQLFSRSIHFAFELTEVYISYTGEYSRILQTIQIQQLLKHWNLKVLLQYI